MYIKRFWNQRLNNEKYFEQSSTSHYSRTQFNNGWGLKRFDVTITFVTSFSFRDPLTDPPTQYRFSSHCDKQLNSHTNWFVQTLTSHKHHNKSSSLPVFSQQSWLLGSLVWAGHGLVQWGPCCCWCLSAAAHLYQCIARPRHELGGTLTHWQPLRHCTLPEQPEQRHSRPEESSGAGPGVDG